MRNLIGVLTVYCDQATIALWREVAMQFMSQSMGWADNIILAMAPLGVITIIVSAIRVGGSSWLKALVGRARENLAVAEAELMSSTSNEVCELRNGRQVVRCMGTAPVVELLCLLSAGWLEKDTMTQPKIKIIDFEAAKGKYLAKIGWSSFFSSYTTQPVTNPPLVQNLNMRDDFSRWRVLRNPPEPQRPDTDPEHEPDDPSEIIIVGKTMDDAAAAPSISFYFHSYFWRGELRAIAKSRGQRRLHGRGRKGPLPGWVFCSLVHRGDDARVSGHKRKAQGRSDLRFLC